MISGVSLFALVAVSLAPSAGAADCNNLPVCGKAGMADVCQKAVQRWDIDDIFETNGAATLARSAHTGSLSCVAQVKCDSSGGFHRFIGSDIRNSFKPILSQCGSCGQGTISGASNCWIQTVGCENCNIPDAGLAVGHINSSVKPPPASTKPPPVSSTRTSSVPPKPSTTTKNPPPPSSTKASSAPPVSTTTKKPPPPVSSTKASSAAPPPTTSKKPDPPPNTTKKPDPPATTTKKPSPPVSTQAPQPNQEEKDTESAENANDAYQKDPTNKSLAEKLKSEIEKALDSVKKAVEEAADDALKGAEQGLEKALEAALAEAAAAAAGPTAAAAAAAAAAMKAVSSAKDSVKEAKKNKPTQKPTTKEPSTKGPTTTFSSSKTRSSTSSSSSSSSSSCPCLSCGDNELHLPAAPEERKRSTALSRRRSRTSKICQEEWRVPDFDSWSSSGGNQYSPFYDSSYTVNMASCTDVDFALTTPMGGRAVKQYATEHVYEIQMVKQFLSYMWLNDAGILAWRAQAANAGKMECDLWPGFLWKDANGHQWWEDDFVGPTPIEFILSQLSSGGARAAEMVYLESDMNSIKGVMFGDRESWVLTRWEVQLAAAARMGSVILYLKDQNIRKIYHDVSKRMHAAWATFDIEASSDHPDPDLKKVKFADGYLKWEKKFLENMETTWKTRPGEEAKGAETKILNDRTASLAAKKVAQNIKAQRENANGKFNSANLLFAQDLLSWFTGNRP